MMSTNSVETSPTVFDYKTWRESFLRIILTLAAGVGLPVVIISVYGSTNPVFTGIYIGAYVILLAATFLPVPYWVRTGVFLFLLYVLSVSGLLETGIWGDSRVFGLAFIVFATLLFSPKAGWVTLGITMLSIIIAGWCILNDLYTLPTNEVVEGNIGIWLSGSATTVLLAIVLINGIRLLQNEFEKAQTRSRQTFEALQAERASLAKRVEERTAELANRTQELETASHVARDAIITQDLDTLLSETAKHIQSGFDLYHVSIFLTDDRNEYAILHAATGDAGKKLLEQNIRLKVGETGIVGAVANSGNSRIALEVDADTAYVSHPLLPESRSEMALPLVVNKRVIGVLDIQSSKRDAFDNNSLRIMQTLADQLAVSIENARLVKRTQDTFDELNQVYRTQIQEAWTRYTKESISGYEYDGLNITPLNYDLPRETLNKLQAGHAVVAKATKKTGGLRPATLIVPLKLRDQLIGMVGIEKEEPNYFWSPEEISIAENAALQTAISLENARLLEDAQRRATRERIIGEASARMRESLNVESVLKSAAQEFQKALGNVEAEVWLDTNEARES